MEAFLIPGLIAATTMSLLVAALYLYLSLNSKDRILQLWSAAWGVYSLCFVIQTFIVLHILPPWMSVLQEAATLTGAFLCIAGAKALADKPAASWWRYGAGISIGWVVLAQSSSRCRFAFRASTSCRKQSPKNSRPWSGVTFTGR